MVMVKVQYNVRSVFIILWFMFAEVLARSLTKLTISLS